MKHIFTIYDGKLMSLEVSDTGKRLKNESKNYPIAFGCRTYFARGDYAESEREAWEQFKTLKESSLKERRNEIPRLESQIALAETKLAELNERTTNRKPQSL